MIDGTAADLHGSSRDAISSFVAWSVLSILVLLHVGQPVVMGVRCISRRVRMAMILLLLLASLLYMADALTILMEVKKVVLSGTTSLRSADGIARFCMDINNIAQQKLSQVLLFLATVYLTLQTFCIPGTVALNAAIGAVVGTVAGVPLCTLLGTLGATSCYLLSQTVGTQLVCAVDRRLMRGTGLPRIRREVQRHRDDIFVFLLFLRLTPVLPNWLVNLASPVVGVPLSSFALATFVGIAPQTYLSVRFGAMARATAEQRALKQGGSGGIVSVWDTLILAMFAVVALAVHRLRRQFAEPATTTAAKTVEV